MNNTKKERVNFVKDQYNPACFGLEYLNKQGRSQFYIE